MRHRLDPDRGRRTIYLAMQLEAASLSARDPSHRHTEGYTGPP